MPLHVKINKGWIIAKNHTKRLRKGRLIFFYLRIRNSKKEVVLRPDSNSFT